MDLKKNITTLEHETVLIIDYITAIKQQGRHSEQTKYLRVRMEDAGWKEEHLAQIEKIFTA